MIGRSVWVNAELSGVHLWVAALIYASFEFSQTEFAVRSNPDELQHGVIRFSIDQHQVRLDVAIPVVFPFTCQGMVSILLGHWFVIGQNCDDGDKISL